MKYYDVIIVGAGPAGSSSAWKLKQLGAKCLILDKKFFPRNKPCAGWINPNVFQELNIGISDYPHALTIFPSIHMTFNGIPLIRLGREYAIRRYEFDQWLLNHSGVPFEVHHVKKITPKDNGYLIDDTYFGNYLIGAGGSYCPVYHTLFKPEEPRDESSRIVAMETEFRYPWKDGRCRLWFFENNLPGYAWYVPKKDGYLNIGVGGIAEKFEERRDNIKSHWRKLIEKLHKLKLVQGIDFNPVSHVYYLNRNNPHIRRGNAFLVGDAVGLATLDMGEGIGPAIKSGLLVAEAIIHKRDYSVNSIPKYSLLPRFLEKYVCSILEHKQT